LAITKEIPDEYRVMLAEEDFLSEETRAEAIKKLDQMQLRIAKPDKWEDDSTLNITGGDEGGNLIKAQDEAGAFWISQLRDKVNQKVDRTYWTSKIQQVNAFYDPSQNCITLCGGILGGDLYNPNMSKEELFANVGDTIAHEISHAFDTTGSQFDEKGNLRNWWTEEDQKAFAARADKLAAYYDEIEPFQDVNCVGSQIEGEAIADLVAVKILLRIAGEDSSFDYDKFFRNFSESWRTITTAQSEYYTLLQDTHPLAYLSVNAVVQQFREFYDTYGIRKGDGMYLAPDQRLEVW
jgi:putative endopeptidase